MEQNDNQISELLEDEEQGGWMVTYADLMTLLLVFFVVLYSISSLNLVKFRRVISSIQVSLGESKPAIGLMELAGATDALDQRFSLEDLSGLRRREVAAFKEINDFIEEKKIGEHAVAHIYKGKLVIQIRGQVLFPSGSATLSREAESIMDQIARIVSRYTEYMVNIKGHTDNVPISTAKFDSNWELSALRATSVLKYFIKRGINPLRLTATGYADILPLVPNNSDENRSRNRRVEFVLEKKPEYY